MYFDFLTDLKDTFFLILFFGLHLKTIGRRYKYGRETVRCFGYSFLERARARAQYAFPSLAQRRWKPLFEIGGRDWPARRHEERFA